MKLDFKEIPKANSSGGEQDTFEFFCRDFLKAEGFKILSYPSRGPDRGMDFIVKETRRGPGGVTELVWLVSCKHHAHSGDSVKVSDEINPIERLIRHKCQGFLGFYSTICSADLEDTLRSIQNDGKYQTQVYDKGKIMSAVDSNPKLIEVFARYFPSSFKQSKVLIKNTESGIRDRSIDIGSLNTVKTALIILEVEKLKEEFFFTNWNSEVLNKFAKFSDHNNSVIAELVLEFAHRVAETTRSNGTELISHIDSLVYNFFPTSYDETEVETNASLGETVVNIGFDIAYDCVIKLNDLYMMQHGLTLIKYAYKYAKHHKVDALTQKVNETYRYLEGTLERPEKDLSDARKLLQVFKQDLDTHSLAYPVVSDDLMGKLYGNRS